MNTKSNSNAGSGCSSHDLLAVERPPSRLPDGRTNPEWKKWWRENTPAGKASVANYNSGGGMAKSKAKIVNAKREKNEVVAKSQVKCLDCGMVFEKDAAELEGFRFLGKRSAYRGLCSSCG